MAEADEDLLSHVAGIRDFWSRYSKLCLEDKIYPAKSIMKNVKNIEWSCIVESIRSDHWKYVLLALCRDHSLAKVHIASCASPHEDEDDDELVAPENIGLKLVPVPVDQMDCQTELCISCCSPAVYRGFIPLVDIQAKMKKHAQYFPTPYGRTPKNISNIATSVRGLLETSETLTILKLENLAFKLEDARQLAEGLYKTTSLKLLSVSGCHFAEDAVPTICNSLKASSVSWIDFSFCALNQTDIEAIANLIKAHCVRRRNDMHQKTLRNQVAYVQDMPGLCRISLNYNTLDDTTIKFLVDSLADDLWVKALDLQNCDIDNAGAVDLLNLASTNTSLAVMDIRMNQIDESLRNKIAKQLEQNKAGKEVKCSELALWKPSEMVRRYNSIGKVKPSRKPITQKFKVSKKVTKSYLNVKKKSRIDDFIEQFTHEKHPEIKYTYVMSPKDKILIEKERSSLRDASCQTETGPHEVNELLVLVKQLKRRLQNEMKIRKFLLGKYREVNIMNAQLRKWLKTQNDDIYVDQETYFDVKHTFEKLKVFFDVMKKYGLWEYISMLGFDESTDIILEENNSQKFMKIKRDETYATVENPEEFDKEVCCNCRKLEYRPRKMEPPNDVRHCSTGTNTKPPHNKVPTKENEINDKIKYKVFQEGINDYNGPHQVLHCKFVSGRMPDNANLTQDNIKLSGCKQPGSAHPNTSTGAQMFIKKFSYSNMPKQLKELVSPSDFYNIVKKELERCELEAKKPYHPLPAENHENSNSTHVSSTQSKKPLYKTHICKNNEVSATSIHLAECRGYSTRRSSKISDEDDDENISISQLIAREKGAGKYNTPKKDSKSPASCASNSKIYKNANHAKNKETKTLSKSDEILLQSKQKLSSSHTNCKKNQSRYNASSDEINSSDSMATPNDKVSPHSSISSSSSSKSHVTDASTFGEIESIADAEVVSETFLSTENLKERVKSSASEPASSHSSTLKGSLESKSNKSNKSALSGSSSIKDSSKKDEKSSKTQSQPQGKNKNANKHTKNRPKSNSSKSSSIPSLSDITTVSSKNLKTYSVMKQIPGSDDDKSKGKK